MDDIGVVMTPFGDVVTHSEKQITVWAYLKTSTNPGLNNILMYKFYMPFPTIFAIILNMIRSRPCRLILQSS